MASQTFPIVASGDDFLVTGAHATDWASVAATVYFGSGATLAPRKRFDAASASDYVVDLALLRFDTSALPDNATITSATLRIYVTSITNVDSRSVCADYFQWVGNNAATDFTVADLSGAMGGPC